MQADKCGSFRGHWLHRLLTVTVVYAGLLPGLAWHSPAQGQSASQQRQPVKMWETQLVLPTYLAGEPEPNPMFFFGRQSQGAQGPVYPYPMYDTLTGRRIDKSYTILYLENEYLKVAILPEIGGRLFEGIDKTNGYHFIYRQHVIKPALIGLIGAWISGGVEWNIPHHHRASTFIPVQYRTEEAADGAKTVWVGELELRHRMRWAVGYTLRPGSSVLETSLRIVNRMPEANSMLCFANAAVHTNEDYQVIFPPSTQYGVHHAKREYVEWPIARTTYGGADFSSGVDISWYKNHLAANSVFAWNYDDDFVAGYDHGKQAGTMSVADHHIVPGKKFWTWGNGPSGRRWDKVLTDEDGPYIELMVGAYSDNQPDYSWLQPFETRAFSIYWYPFRDIGGVKRANTDAAVNLEVDSGAAKLGFYTTTAHPAARVLVKAGEQTLLDRTIAIDPGKPFTASLPLPAGTDPHSVVASLSTPGRELIRYQSERLEKAPAPTLVKAPPPPAEVASNEELYLIGLRAQQFHSPSVDPLPYWQEALRRDPQDARVHTALGVTAFRKARYLEAERHLQQAVARVTKDHTSPKDAEALYYLGITLRTMGKHEEAEVLLHRARWSFPWKPAAYLALAQMAAARGSFGEALRFADFSLEGNSLNLRALNLKAAALRHLGRPQEALAVLRSGSAAADPLDARALAETFLATRSAQDATVLARELNRHPGAAQETAAEYLQEGLWEDGITVLQTVMQGVTPGASVHPMLHYYLGFFQHCLGRNADAVSAFQAAAQLPAELVFPFQREAIPVLRQAMRANPRDGRAPFYLGNLLYDWQPKEAQHLWELSAELDPANAIVHRNLAVAYLHQATGSNTARAISALERAVSARRKYPLHFAELDELYQQEGAPLERRKALLEQNLPVVTMRDDSLNRLIGLQVASGQLDEAIRQMSSRSFAVAEGANLNVVEHWAEAHVQRARRRIAARQFAQAIEDLQAAAATPENLPVMNLEAVSARAAELAWWRGLALEGLGKSSEAQTAFLEAASASPQDRPRRPTEQPQPARLVSPQAYYQGLALRKLGREPEAVRHFQQLLASATGQLRQMEGPSTGAAPTHPWPNRNQRAVHAQAHYLAGLSHLGLADSAKARDAFTKALELSPDHVGARMALHD